jgi:flagellar hook assembly protein FlgD
MRFVFTLTGNDIPDEVHIKIMTADGRVVKHVHQDELGPMHIGNNISQWSWDGTDQFGDRLANGVYFYQVTVRKDGKKLEHFESAGDASFKQQVGKIYLLR